MKRITAIFLLLTFLTANTGMAVTVHYCGGKLSSIDLFSFDKHNCKCGKKAMKKNCCKNKIAYLKVKTDAAKTNLLSFKIVAPRLIAEFTTQVINTPPIQRQYVAAGFYHPPPFKPKAPIYLLDRVFLI